MYFNGTFFFSTATTHAAVLEDEPCCVFSKVMMFRLFGEKCAAFSEEETRRESLLGAWHRVQWKFLRKHKVLNLKEHKMTPGYCWSGTTAPGSKYKLHCLALNGFHLLFAY